MKWIMGILLSLAVILTVTACSGKASVPSSGYNAKDNDNRISDADSRLIELTIWCADEEQEFIAERVEAFKTSHSDQKFNITVSAEPESNAVDAVLADVKSAADIYAFTHDSLAALIDGGALLALDDAMSAILAEYSEKSIDDVKSANTADSVDAVSSEFTMYAFPMGVCEDQFLCIGVNPNVKNAGWAVALAEFLTNEESQIARYNARRILPTNIAADASIQSAIDSSVDDNAE